MKPETMTIGRVAAATGLGIETIRFYERQGLIPDPPRRLSGYRDYPSETVDRLRFIRRAKELGFSLKEISELLELRVDPRKSRKRVKTRVDEKIRDVEGKIESLQRMRIALEALTETCDGMGSTDECPILRALA